MTLIATHPVSYSSRLPDRIDLLSDTFAKDSYRRAMDKKKIASLL